MGDKNMENDDEKLTTLTIKNITEREKNLFATFCAGIYGKSMQDCLRDLIRSIPVYFSPDIEMTAFRVARLVNEQPKEIDEIIKKLEPLYALLNPQHQAQIRHLYAVMNPTEIFNKWKEAKNSSE
jgi:hypothetical protein